MKIELIWCILFSISLLLACSLVDSHRTVCLENQHIFLQAERHVFFVGFSHRATFPLFSSGTRRWVSLILLGSLRRDRKSLCFERLFPDHFPMVLELGRPFGKGDGEKGVSGRVDEVTGEVAGVKKNTHGKTS